MQEARNRRVELKHNTTITNDPCAFCGTRTDPDGLDYFKAGTWALVCDGCAQRYAPELVQQKMNLRATNRKWPPAFE